MSKSYKYFMFLMIAVLLAACESSEQVSEMSPEVAAVQKQVAKFAPVEITYNRSHLSDRDHQALLKLVQVGRLMHEIFFRQAYHNNIPLRRQLLEDQSKSGQILYEYFDINVGPFDRLENNAPFIAGVEPKPAGANYYPADMTKAEFEQWLTDNPDDADEFTSITTLIRRDGDQLLVVPYPDAYHDLLEPAAELMNDAAALAVNPSLKKYLKSRAEALLSNDYYQSDMDWMDLKDHALEVVIGPYEVYEDELFGYKAAFTAFLTIVDPVDSENLQKISAYLDDLERALPIDDQYKNFDRGGFSPIVVVNEVYTAGDTRAGVQTTAFNLPNDERVREARGSKKVMLKNITEAKYRMVSTPIMKRVLAEKDLAKVSFDAFFNHIVLHEMCHGIGPGKITVNGRATTVNKELRDLYSVLEEAKADVVGLYQFPLMIEKGVFAADLRDKLYASFVGGIFRSVRFGTSSAHGGANLITLNYLMEKGGVDYDKNSGKFSVNDDQIEAAVRALSHDILMIQAKGDYQQAESFIKKYRYVSEPLQNALNNLEGIPVDIRPIYAVEKELAK